MSKFLTNRTAPLNPAIIDKASLLNELFSDNVEICKCLEEILPEDVLTTGSLEHSFGSRIDDELANALAKILPYTRLTSLELSYSDIGDARAKDLAEALKYNSTLASLDLSNNEINAYGAKNLAKVLKYNSTLTYLDLGHNNYLTYGEHNYLMEALKENFTLTYLKVHVLPTAGEAAHARVKNITALIDRNIALFNEFAERLVQDNTDSTKY